MKQYIITPSMGKRLIGRALAGHPEIQQVIASGTLVIIAGSTNGYAAEEILKSIGQEHNFSRVGFRRGLVTPSGYRPPEHEFPGDLIIQEGQLQAGRTIFEAVDELQTGDMVLKGANAVDTRGQAAVHIGGSTGGTILAAMTAIVGRRVKLLVPVGLEKRVFEDVNEIAKRLNHPDTEGPRLLPIPGEIFTELDAIRLLSGAQASLVSAGGVYGAEGAVRLGVRGTEEQMQAVEGLIGELTDELLCAV